MILNIEIKIIKSKLLHLLNNLFLIELAMAQFYIQTDKEFYFAGDTVNGSIFINVGALILGATGISMKFSGYECVKWVEAT